MQSFQKGDLVFHTEHGAGVLIATRHMEVGESTRSYYVVELSTGSTLMIPVDKDEENAQLRPLISGEILAAVLSSPPGELSKDFRVRQQQLGDKLNSGDQRQNAEALRDLLWREQNEHLSTGDRRLMDLARKRVVFMVAAQHGMSIEDAASRLGSILKKAQTQWTVTG